MDFAAATFVAIIGVAAFAFALAYSGLVPVARALIGSVSSGVTVMLDSSLDDAAKERAVRVAGLSLLAGAWKIGWRFALSLACVVVPILLADLAGLVPRAASFGILLRVDFIVIVSLLAILVVWVLRRSNPAVADEKITDSSAYGAGERMIHALAFSGSGSMKSLIRLDDRLFAATIAAIPETPPVFITSLARGGTTALLNAMYGLPQIATHRYCDMPFVGAPLLWSKLAWGRRSMAERERAHGDGMKIGLQSPEAFDEIFWQLYWPEKYGECQIDLWHLEDQKPEAQAFFSRHFRKIVHLRHPEDVGEGVRYLSKNNANIARLDMLPAFFPGCSIVIALREPAAHAASLFRQHRNFIELHAEDSFGMRYMRDIGHLEFGALHKPIAFDLDRLAAFLPKDPDYWLAYWISAFENVASHADDVLIVTQPDLRAAPEATMLALMDRLQLTAGRAHDFGAFFRRSADLRPDIPFDPELLRKAQELYDRLAARRVA